MNKKIQEGRHGIALWDVERRLVWGNAASNLTLEPGNHELVHVLSTLPLRPGVYQWLVSLYDGESQLDLWNAVPELIVGTEPMTHPRDEWAGILNMPCQFRIEQSHERT